MGTATLTDSQPRLAEGLELIGEYADSGFKEAPYIVRRADGQVIQLPHLLYLIAESVDGRRSYEEIAEDVTEKFGRGLDADMVRKLVDEQLRSLGVVAPGDGSTPELQKADPMLALKLRTAVIPPDVVGAITRVFWPLFLPPAVIAGLGGPVPLELWPF